MHKKLLTILPVILALTGCGTSEPAEPVSLKPYSVQTAKKAALKQEPVEIAQADVVTPEPTPTLEPTPEPTEPPASSLEKEAMPEPEPEPVTEAVAEEPVYIDIETAEELPPPADSFEDTGMTYLGVYTVTWYSRDMVGYDAPGASGNGLTPYYSCAMPDYGLLNCTIYVENYGFFHVDDISPDGICDLFVNSVSEIPAYGQDYQMVYIVG